MYKLEKCQSFWQKTFNCHRLPLLTSVSPFFLHLFESSVLKEGTFTITDKGFSISELRFDTHAGEMSLRLEKRSQRTVFQLYVNEGLLFHSLDSDYFIFEPLRADEGMLIHCFFKNIRFVIEFISRDLTPFFSFVSLHEKS